METITPITDPNRLLEYRPWLYIKHHTFMERGIIVVGTDPASAESITTITQLAHIERGVLIIDGYCKNSIESIPYLPHNTHDFKVTLEPPSLPPLPPQNKSKLKPDFSNRQHDPNKTLAFHSKHRNQAQKQSKRTKRK